MPTSFHKLQADLYSALAHPTRIQILEMLKDGEMTVGAVQKKLGSGSSTISQQLAILRAQRLVDHRRSGTSVYYTVSCSIHELLTACQNVIHCQADTVWNSLPKSDNGERPTH